MDKNINDRINNAAKWSSITEIIAKFISPITNMILAHLLAPEMFGIVATVTMVFSFAEMFTDAGFQKFIIQHEFENKKELDRHADVAFWSNFSVSMLFFGAISLFADEIAWLVGCEGLGNVFVISCISLPLTAFSSIQIAIYRRNFDFKTLFKIRVAGVVLPLVVTVPLAVWTRDYWALIIGTICGHIMNAVILTIKSPWKPSLYYDITLFKKMLSFSAWSLVEAVSIWLTQYIGVFIVGNILSTHYLGLYKTAMTTVNQFTSVVTAAFTPVLFSALSRLQSDQTLFKQTFYKFQRITAYLVVPMGIGIFLYRDLITEILLGNQWTEAAGFVGAWGAISSIKIIYSNYCYEIYRAYGRPKLAVLAQICQLVVLIPAIYFSAKVGFVCLYIARTLVVVELLIVNQIIMKSYFGYSIRETIKNTYIPFVASAIMMVFATILQNIQTGIVWDFISIALCIGVYFATIFVLFPKQKSELMSVFNFVRGVNNR